MKTRLYGFVVDKDGATKMRKEKALKGGWQIAFHTLLGLPAMHYAVVWTPDVKRLKKNAPMIILAADSAHLQEAMRMACQSLSEVYCEWRILADAEATTVAQRELLADAVSKGTA